MTDRLDLPARLPLRAADADLLNAVLARFSEPHPIAEGLALRIRASDRAWSTADVDLMTIGGAALAYEWLALPPDLPPGLQLPPERLAALPRSVRPLMSAMMLLRAARTWPGPRPEHAGLRHATGLAGHVRFVFDFLRDGVPAGSLLVGLARSDAVTLARAAGLSETVPLAPDPTVTIGVLPRIASLTVTAAEVEALAPGDVVLLGPLEAPFDALRIGTETRPVRKTEDGGFILDISP